MVLNLQSDTAADTEANPQGNTLSLPSEERESDSPLIELIWRGLPPAEHVSSFTSIATPHTEMVISKYRGVTTLTVRGPETKPTDVPMPSEDMQAIGIVFRLGTFMPQFPTGMLLNAELELPEAGSHTFWLDSSVWEFPDFENADTFIDRLVKKELLLHDPLIDRVLNQQPLDLTERTMQRRFKQATGLTYSATFQMQRARYATYLLNQGNTITDVVGLAGYSDQPHLTRDLRRFMGQTPGQISTKTTDKPMSVLFKTAPF